MKRTVAGALVAFGCGSLLGDRDRVIALELEGGLERTIHVNDTLRLVARAVTAAGDSVPGAAIEWAVLDTLVTAFALDSQTGTVIGLEPGTGRVQASFETLRSDPVRITVTSTP